MRKKEPSQQKERISFSFSSDQRSDNTYIFLAAGERPHASAVSSMLVNLPLVAAVSVDMQPKYKKYQMDLSNYELKTPDLDISPQKRLLTLLTP